MTATAQLTIAILTALMPTVAVLIGSILQRQDSRDVRAEVGALRTELHAKMDTLRADIQSDMLSLRNQVHVDLLMIHERVAKVEARQGQ